MNKIISPSTLEHCCRRSIAAGSKQGALPLRMALAASITHGNGWFSVNDVCSPLGTSKDGNTSIARVLGQRLSQTGIAEAKLQKSGMGFKVNVARLTCDLVDQSHFHGMKSLQLRSSIETFYCNRPYMSPVAALLLIGLHVFQIHQSRELSRFIGPEANVLISPAMCARTLYALQEAGLLFIDPNPLGRNRPYLVYPLQKDAS